MSEDTYKTYILHDIGINGLCTERVSIPERSSFKGTPVQSSGLGLGAVISGLEHIAHMLSNVRSELDVAPTIVERLSRIAGILPEVDCFNAEDSKDYVELESNSISDIRENAGDLLKSL